MTLSIGIDFDNETWRTCMMEDGQTLELCSFGNSTAALAYVERSCALYPELPIVVASNFETTVRALHGNRFQAIDEMHVGNVTEGQASEVNSFLIVIGTMNLNSFCAPSVKYLPGVPMYRKLMRPHLGSPGSLCAGAALLHGLRAREAGWSEMQFLFVRAGYESRSILVIEDGRIVNGIGETWEYSRRRARALMNGTPNPHSGSYSDERDDKRLKMQEMGHGETTTERSDVESASEEAYWEGLTQELAGLMAVHQFEDIVVVGDYKEAFIERFSDSYQIYLFPYNRSEHEGYESALGAAVIAEGLYGTGLTVEVVERLQIREANEISLNRLIV